jgi:hypothetical protein
MKKFYVLTYMDNNQDAWETAAFYQGEFELGNFPAKVAYWHENFLVVPHWFDSEEAARQYIQAVRSHTPVAYCMVQERHYVNGDPRIAVAKIIATLYNDFPIQPSRGRIQEKAGDPMTDVWTMFILGRELAEQYVNAFNANVEAARRIKGGQV